MFDISTNPDRLACALGALFFAALSLAATVLPFA